MLSTQRSVSAMELVMYLTRVRLLLQIGQPFDTVKTRMQTSPGRFPSWLACIRSTIRHEGALALYRGASPVFAGKGMVHGCLLGSFEHTRSWLSQAGCARDSALVVASSGALAGACSSVIVAPIDQVKTVLQVQYRTRTRTTVPPALAAPAAGRHDIFSGPTAVISRLRLRGLYSQWPISLLEMSVVGMVYFSLYHHAKQVLVNCPPVSCAPPAFSPSVELRMFACGAIAGMSTVVTTLPIDVVKSRLLTQVRPACLLALLIDSHGSCLL